VKIICVCSLAKVFDLISIFLLFQLYYDELNTKEEYKRKIDQDNCMFLLSAGLLFVDNYDPTNKYYGFKLFNILLSYCVSYLFFFFGFF